MKLPAALLILLAGWLVAMNSDSRFSESVGDLTGGSVTAVLTVAVLAVLLLRFTGGGKIHLADDHLAVRTPTGSYRIPYSRIEAIRRCRRSGTSRSERLQVMFQSLGERKVLEISPPDMAGFTEKLHRRCPQLSSARNGSLIRQGGYGKVIHPRPFLKQRSTAGYRETVY